MANFIERNELFISFITDPDTLSPGVTRDEHDFLVFCLRGETEKIENWIKAHRGETLPVHNWLADENNTLPADALHMAFFYATVTAQVNAMQCITDHAAIDINRPCGADGQTLLHIVAQDKGAEYRIPALSTLLELGADPTLKSNNGNTPADLALACGLPETADFLKELANERQAQRALIDAKKQKARFERNIDRLNSLLGPHRPRKTG